MKCRFYSAAIWSSILMLLLLSTAYANSSWHWVTTSPLTVLPFAVIFTLLIETFLIARLGEVSDIKKTFIIISLANLVSFVAPYLERAYRFIPTSGGYSILAAFNKGPFYMVLGGYLLLTIIVELPIVYFLLKGGSSNKKKLTWSIIASNIITTLLVAACERMICIGRW